MDNTISKLLDFFKHIVRDLLTYILSGFVVIMNIVYTIFYFDKDEFTMLLSNTYIIWLFIIFSYIVGHIIMGIMLLFLEKTKIDDILLNETKINQKKEIDIYNKNAKLYEFFIERQNQLYYTRWNLAGAFFINTFINLYLFFTYTKTIFSYLTFISILSFAFLLVLHYQTAKDYSDTINNCYDILDD